MTASEENRSSAQSHFIIRSTMRVGCGWECSDRPINEENGLNPMTRYCENAFWGFRYYYHGTHKIPLMPRFRIDRRKTKPTTRKREMEILITRKGEPVSSTPFSLLSFPPTPSHLLDYFQILTVTSFLFLPVSLRSSPMSVSLGSNEWRLNAQHLMPESRFPLVVQYRVQREDRFI